MGDNPENWPEMTFPPAEAELVLGRYAEAGIILEYGSGGSTVRAAGVPGKLVFSVESDAAWALKLQTHIDAQNLPSSATVYHVDIGPTGQWGRPVGPEAWQGFWRYPAAIWDTPYFRHPDVVLIDGRFRPACLVTTLSRIERPVTILFDDYATRPAYHDVERIIRPVEIVGRMAVFEAEPGVVNCRDLTLLLDLFFRATYAGSNAGYTSRTLAC